MESAKDYLALFEQEKNMGLSTETALRVVFGYVIANSPTLSLRADISDNNLFRLLEKRLNEWNIFIRKVKKINYGPIPVNFFEKLSKETKPDFHKRWMTYRKKVKK